MTRCVFAFLAACSCQALLADAFAPTGPYNNYDQASFLASIPAGYEAVPLTSPYAPVARASTYTGINGLTLDNRHTFTDTVSFGFGKYDFGELTFSKPIYGFAGVWNLGTDIIAGASFGPPDAAHLQLTGYDIDHNPTYGFEGFWGAFVLLQDDSVYTGQRNAITILPDHYLISGLSPHPNEYGGGFTTTDIEVVVPTPEPSSWALILTGSTLVGLALRRRKQQVI